MYEMFAGHFPYSDLPADVVIYQVGKGYRQPLSDLNCLSFVKVGENCIFQNFWDIFNGQVLSILSMKADVCFIFWEFGNFCTP